MMRQHQAQHHEERDQHAFPLSMQEVPLQKIPVARCIEQV